ncbi:MAG: Ig-like domain repeat protein [Verrucomicrobiota bacterium]
MVRSRRLQAALPSLALVAALLGITAQADTHTWTGGGANNNWTNALNWGGAAPTNGDSLVFDGNARLITTNNFAANTTFSNITFNSGAGAFTLRGNAFALAGIIVNDSTNLQIFNLGFSSSSTCNVNTAMGDILAKSPLSGKCVLNKSGEWKLTLAANNSYTGGTIVVGGTLSISNENMTALNLGATNWPLTLAGGTLEVTGELWGKKTNILWRKILLGTGGGTIVNSCGTVLSIGREGNFFGTNEVIIGGTLANGLTTKGEIVIRPGAQNVIGRLTVDSGRASLRNDNGNRYPVAPSDEIVVNGGAILNFTDHMPRSISNSMTFASDAVLCTRTHADYSGAMTQSTSNAHFPSAGRMFFNYDDQATDVITINGAYPDLTGDLTIQVGGVSPTVGTVTLNGAISGDHAFSKTASGTLVLNATNTYTGGTTVSGGTLEVRKDGGLGSGSVNVASGATLRLSSGATHDYINNSASLLLTNSAVVNLAYSGTDTIDALSFDGGATLQASGTWGSLSSTAAHKDSHFAGSGLLNVVFATTTAVGSSTNPSAYGQPPTFTATVAAINPAAGAPGGTVQFRTNGGNFGSAVVLSGGVATSGALPATTPAGTYTVTAVYIPSNDFGASTGTLAGGQTVDPLPVSLTGSRAYDGTAAAAAEILTVANKVGGDDVTVASGTGTLAGAAAGAQAITSFGTLTLGGAAAGSYTLAGATGAVTITAGAVAQTRVETAADGSGVVVGGQSVRTGDSITVYAILRDAGGNFVTNATATWTLTDISGGVVAGDLVQQADGRSAIFTGHAAGTARIQATAGGFAGQSGVLAVPLEAGVIHLPAFEGASIGTAQPAYPGQTYWVNGTNNDQYAQWSIAAGDGVGGSDAAVARPGPNAIGNDGSAIQALRVYYFPVVSNTPYAVSFLYKAIGTGFTGLVGSNASEMQFLVLESPNLEGGSWLPWYGTNIGTASAEWTNALYTFTTQPATRCVCLKFGMLFGYGNRTDPTDSFYLDDDRGTTQTLASSVNPSVCGQPVTFTATVSPVNPAAGTPTGTVQFRTNGANFGSAVVLSGGSATSDALPATTPAGTYAVTADYGGDDRFTRSTGALAGGQTVNKAASGTILSSSQNPSVAGEPVTFTVTVTATPPGAGTPAGTVQFKVDGADLGTAVALSGGSASNAAPSGLAVGTHAVTAEYSGDAGFNASTGTLAGGQAVDSRPRLQISAGSMAWSNVVEWSGTSSWYYTIQYSTSLCPFVAWSDLPGCVGITGWDGTMSAADTSGAPERMYYRIRMTR